MLLKKYGSLLLVAALSVTAFSCDDDDDPIIDITDPDLTITSPTEAQLTAGYTQGETIEVRGTASDDGELDFAELTITAPDGSTIWYENRWEYDSDVADISDDIAIPADAPVGTHTMAISVNDITGNTEDMEWTFDIMEDAPMLPMVTFNVTIPEPVEQDIYIAGELADADGNLVTWDEPGTNPDLMLTKIDDLNYTITLPVADSDADNDIEYKYFLGEGWNQGQQNANCEAVQAEVDIPTGEVTFDDTVEAWEGSCGG